MIGAKLSHALENLSSMLFHINAQIRRECDNMDDILQYLSLHLKSSPES